MSKKKQKRLKICRVHWRDHYSTEGWHTAGEVTANADGFIIESVGWLVDETEDALLLAMSVSRTKAADYLCIIKAAVVDRWEL